MRNPLVPGPAVAGRIQIHETVISTIVQKIAAAVPGVARISGSSFVDNLAELVGSKRFQDKAISVEMGDSSVSVKVSVSLLFGFRIPEVAGDLQQKIVHEIEKLTGLAVQKVDVVVREIEDAPETPAEKE